VNEVVGLYKQAVKNPSDGSDQLLFPPPGGLQGPQNPTTSFSNYFRSEDGGCMFLQKAGKRSPIQQGASTQEETENATHFQ